MIGLQEVYLPLSQVCDAVPSRPCVSTVWRWSTRGCRGVKLRTTLIGGQRFTTEKWVAEFLVRLNGGAQ